MILSFFLGGGQPHDTGIIDEARVLEVVREGDVCVHITDRELVVGSKVHVKLDWSRRFDHVCSSR